MNAPLLEIDNLHLRFANGDVPALSGLDLRLHPGEILGVVGESGCGKSAMAMAVLGLHPPGAARVGPGAIRFRGEDLTTAAEARMRAIRGNAISMIFQEPMTSLNPMMTVGGQILEAIRLHRDLDRRAARAEALSMLEAVGIRRAAERMDQYPHHLSGGMRQRVMIAIALVCRPAILIADEPTTALDVTVQAQVMRLIVELARRNGTAVVLITHDLGIVHESCDRVAVLYAGRKVEEGTTAEVLAAPRHPYTQALLRCTPRFGARDMGATRLETIPGMLVPGIADRPGCAFADRCPRADHRCRLEKPAPEGNAGLRMAECFHPHEEVRA